MGTESIRLQEILPALIEIGGNEVMNDFILQIAIESELSKKSITISHKEIDTERRLFQTRFDHLPKTSIDKVLLEKGYGPVRERQLLWRNAALRKLVASDVDVTSNSIRRMYEIIHGTSFPVRIIVTTTQKEAGDIFALLSEGKLFPDLAIQFSIDSSASRGGLVDPIPIADPLWPAPLRESLPEIRVGEYSKPIFIGDRWIIVQVTKPPITSDTTFEEVKVEMQQLAQLAQERFLMEALAESLQKKYKVTFFNKELKQVSSTNVD